VRRLLALAAAIVALSAAPARAQYFGQNKVRYQNLEFHVLATEHFDVHYYGEETDAARAVARMAERWYARLSVLFGHQLRRRQPILLYAGHPAFAETGAIDGDVGEGTGGITDFARQRVVLPCAGPLAETDHVLGHELVHAFQFDLTRRRGHGIGAARLPLWFIEGMAEYVSLGRDHAQTAMWMREAVRTETVPDLKRIGGPRYFPYRYGHAFWAYVGGRYGDARIAEILRVAGRSGNAVRAIETVLGTDAETLSRDWRVALEETYRDTLATRGEPGRGARAVITAAGGGRLNLGPALSPDGKQLLFLSERSGLSVDLYLADAETGRVRRQVVDRATSAHFESLQFVASAGAWAPDGRRLAFAAVHAGRPALTIAEAEEGRLEREVALTQFDEITGPAWSPDGGQIVFSALHGGLTDLAVYDLASGTTRTLTRDAYADIQPAWSPDGRTIVFVTDRFASDLEALRMGTYGLALLDVETGETRPLPTFAEAPATSPQWSPDGRRVYFVSERGGVPNVYRVDRETGERRQVTDVPTGIAGLTPLSPALSVAAATGRLAMTLYVKGRYEIFTIDSAEALAGRPLAPLAATAASLLPPVSAGATPTQAEAGAPPVSATAFAEKPYRRRLSLDRIGQPFLSASGGALGTYFSGGGAVFWSDMLGEQSLLTAAQMTGRNVSVLAAYRNQRRRLSWGVAAEQVPFEGASVSSGFADANGQAVGIEQSFRFRETNRRVAGVLAYPLSRADRIEWSGAYRRVSFSSDLSTRTFSLPSGNQIGRQDRTLAAPTTLDIEEAGAAFVHDSAVFGAASPILGRRVRAEITAALGAVRHQDLLADVRHYVMPIKPVTVAVRGLFFGRFGRDAGDPRIAPLFLGDQSLVRGYSLGSYLSSACLSNSGVAGCSAVERFTGSRMVVGNVEVRVPLAALFGRRGYGPIPMELALFGDGGQAWTTDAGAARRHAARSVGVALRVNLLGFLVGEVDYFRAFDRTDGHGGWQVTIGPGF